LAHVIRILASETSGNRPRRAALAKVRPDVLLQPGIQEYARGRRGWLGPSRRQGVRRAGPIRSVSGVAGGRLTVVGARPNIDAIARSDWSWVRPRLKVSRAASLKCM
jgi:hypothetical protein